MKAKNPTSPIPSRPTTTNTPITAALLPKNPLDEAPTAFSSGASVVVAGTVTVVVWEDLALDSSSRENVVETTPRSKRETGDVVVNEPDAMVTDLVEGRRGAVLEGVSVDEVGAVDGVTDEVGGGGGGKLSEVDEDGMGVVDEGELVDGKGVELVDGTGAELVGGKGVELVIALDDEADSSGG